MFFRRVVLKEVFLIKCCIEKECLGLKELLKTTESAVQDEAGTCKTIFSSDIDVIKSEEFVESEKAMENVEAMSVIANANDTEISNSPLKKPAQTLQKRQSEEYIREVKRICLSSSSSYRAGSTDIPDPLSPLLPIVHRPRQVFRTTSCILTQLLNVRSSWSSCPCAAVCGDP